jgi:hypothetical protein
VIRKKNHIKIKKVSIQDQDQDQGLIKENIIKGLFNIKVVLDLIKDLKINKKKVLQ